MSVERDENRKRYKAYLDAFAYPDAVKSKAAVVDFFAADASVNVVHPFNELPGASGYFDGFIGSLMSSFEGLYRRDYIVMAGAFNNAEWITSTGYFVGKFVNDWIGIKASGKLTYLRIGEFHKMVDGKSVESYTYLDIPELMIGCGQWPITLPPGHCGYLPGPATQDGLLLSESSTGESEKSYQLTTDMLAQLNTPDEGWRPYWHKNMLWYGPAAFGSYVGIEDFAGFQVPFESCFDGWSGGSANNGMTEHLTRFGDGVYSASAGWPSLTGVNVKPFLDQPTTNERVFMRVCDWWRRDGDLFVENWVFVDIPDLLRQLGRDLFEKV